jgi:hypothetical protein
MVVLVAGGWDSRASTHAQRHHLLGEVGQHLGDGIWWRHLQLLVAHQNLASSIPDVMVAAMVERERGCQPRALPLPEQEGRFSF